MKHLALVRYYLGTQSTKHLWLSTFVVLGSLFGLWYTLGYKPLVCAAQNLEDRLMLCTNSCDKDKQDKVLFNQLEEKYKATVKLLSDYKGGRDASSFYHHAVDKLINSVRSAQCSLVSFSSESDVSQDLYKKHQATLVVTGNRLSVMHCLNRLKEEHFPWRVTMATVTIDHNEVYHMTLALECFALV